MQETTWSNALESHDKVAYIVGEGYELLTGLSRVLTIKQFKIAVLEQRLPLHRLWIVGQGLNQDDLSFLRLCEMHLQGVRFHLGSSVECSVAESPRTEYVVSRNKNNLDWQHFHFMDSARVKAELNVTQLPESDFLAQDFLFTAARELTERACRSAVNNGVLIIKQASFFSFHRLLPLPISVETKFQIAFDNKRSLKSLTRFYQGYACTSEVTLSFDLYSKEEASEFYKELAEKTVEQYSKIIENE